MMALIASVVSCYVGCNTGSPDKQALHVLECDTETGAAKIVQSVKDLQGTTYFQFDGEGRYLYSVIGEKVDGKARGTAVRFAMDGDRIGKMERLAALPCEAPCHVSLTPDGSRVAFAANTSATAGTLPVAGGAVASAVLPDVGMGTNAKRQKKAYAHFTFFTPDAKRLGVIDLGCDRIHFFDPVTMAKDEAMTIRDFVPGEGPRHAVWSKDSRFLFVLTELGSTVVSFAFDGTKFSFVGRWSMLPTDFSRWEADGVTLSTKAAAIKLTADGKVLMASNRGHDSIAIYEVDAATGKLALRNIAKLTGKFPRDFELMPGEKFVVVGHKMSDEIRIYRFDRGDFSLTPVGEPIPAWRPLCFKFK